MYFTGLADEHFSRKDIEQIEVLDVHESKIKICRLIVLTEHNPSVRLGPAVVSNIIASRPVEPGVLHLDFDQRPLDVENQII